MSTMRKTGSFGSAKPLPGQNGYKESQTALLEREAVEMENRLKMLQERMQQQNDADEKLKTTTSGGTRWSGASKKKGSVTSYAKDVQERHKKQSTRDPSKKATAAARRAQREQNSAKGGFNDKDVEQWSVEDVGEWLTSMLLQQHVQNFASNAISGPILLEVSLEDLDYMEVKALAHRKIILKGVEDLRKNKRVTKQLFAPTASLQPSSLSSKDDNNSNNVGRVTPEKEDNVLADRAKVPSKAHWSTLEPLRMKEVTDDDGEGGGGHIVNGADSGGMLDEEAERRAFQEAVMQWRQGTSATEKGGKSLLVNADSGDNGQWSNPFGGDSTAKSSATSAAGMDNNHPDDMVIVSARGHNESYETNPRGASLANGMLDEEKERKEFQAAVEAWRSGEDKPNSKNKDVAEKLAKQMDAMHEQSSAKLKEDQDNMVRKIQKARDELAKAKISLESSNLEIESYDDTDDVIVGYGNAPSNYFGGDSLSPCPSIHDDDEDDALGDSRQLAQSTVEVELIESTVMRGGVGVMPAAQVAYSVDEPSSDDES